MFYNVSDCVGNHVCIYITVYTLAFKIYKTTVNTNSWNKDIFNFKISDQCLQEDNAKIHNSSKLKFYQVVFNNFKIL